ncbi:lipocalin family protein [Bdellovibrio sp. HCB290]|uniref:lipocalin family protein n=1 Tax=Bdellovibrio sp. HCB290 TaxID=3394356 RepID=UPI0039B51456
MKKLLIFSIVFSFPILALSSAAQVQTVPKVDLSQYIGKWYEIASIPHSFQKQCVRAVTADYRKLENGYIEVINSCETPDGTRSVSEGRAKVVDPLTNAKLKVTFVKLFGWIFSFGGDYWILDLDEDYRYAVVGHPTRKYGWILSRNPNLSMTDLKLISDKLKVQGYDLCSLLMTIQDDSISSRIPLCEYVKP